MGTASQQTQKQKGLAPKKGKAHPTVQVVVAPTGFPISSKQTTRKTTRRRQQQQQHETATGGTKARDDVKDKGQHQKNHPLVLDLHQAKKEVRNYGATAFEGELKRSFEDEQYRILTGGRTRKRQAMPPNIARNARKKAEKRQEAKRQEAKQAGIILPTSSLLSSSQQQHQAKYHKAQKHKEYHQQRSAHGPAPSTAGIMKNGVLHLSKKPF